MSDPLWNDDSVGAAKRVAHYLATVVQEGNVFDKAILRDVVPGTEQVDRRMRDLRKVGWKILTYKERATLEPNRLYLEKIGDHVWEEGYKWPEKGLTAGKRRKVYDRDGRRCMVCGIDFGDEYPDRPGVKARGTIGHILPKERGGGNELENLRPECQFCNEAARNLTEPAADVPLLKRRVLELSRSDKQALVSWMLSERRTFSEMERLWAQYIQLPLPSREEIRETLIAALQP